MHKTCTYALSVKRTENISKISLINNLKLQQNSESTNYTGKFYVTISSTPLLRVLNFLNDCIETLVRHIEVASVVMYVYTKAVKLVTKTFLSRWD